MCSSIPTPLLRSHPWSEGFTRAWLIPECIWSEWIMPFRFIMALYFSSLSSFLVCSAPGNQTYKTGYIFYCMCAVTHAHLGIRRRRSFGLTARWCTFLWGRAAHCTRSQLTGPMKHLLDPSCWQLNRKKGKKTREDCRSGIMKPCIIWLKSN